MECKRCVPALKEKQTVGSVAALSESFYLLGGKGVVVL
jgi:hypothetical protein